MANNDLHLKFHALLTRNLNNRITPELVNGLASALGMVAEQHLEEAMKQGAESQVLAARGAAGEVEEGRHA